MRKPASLQKGDTIAVVAPSFGIRKEEHAILAQAIKNLEKKGYHVDILENVFKSDGLGISTSPESCAQELMEAYVNPQYQAIISASGGELMCETLSHMDFVQLKNASPKWFCGFSDNTNMTFTLNTLCDVMSIYGPHILDFALMNKCTREALGMMQGTCHHTSDYPYYSLDDFAKKPKVITAYHHGKKVDHVQMKGVLLGGCLDVLANLVGTRFDQVKEKDEHHVIWFLEACDLNPLGIRRALWQLKEAGWFKHISGLMLGRPLSSMGVTMLGVDEYNAVLDIFQDIDIPILFDCDFGHIGPTMPIISGANAKVTYEERLKIEYYYK